MQNSERISALLTLKWSSEGATHCDKQLIHKIDFWRDIFPGDLEEKLKQCAPGESCSAIFGPGELIEPYSDRQVRRFREKQFSRNFANRTVEPRLGHFYPRGIAYQAVNCYPEDFRPLRLIEVNDEYLSADLNHPMARYPAILSLIVQEALPGKEEHGGTCNDLGELATNGGPGMQIPYPGVITDFIGAPPLKRQDDNPDSLYYAQVRMVDHLDRTAQKHIATLYGSLIPKSARVLDLMSSIKSHLPEDLHPSELIGLGMNQDELDANPALDHTIVQDLNCDSQLPFEDASLDAVICTASVEYLTDPISLFKEVNRTLKSGGLFICSFSDRYFPTKAIDCWVDLHNFERMGLVSTYFQNSDGYKDIHTESIRGFYRPEGDPYASTQLYSDPVFAVWAYKQ